MTLPDVRDDLGALVCTHRPHFRHRRPDDDPGEQVFPVISGDNFLLTGDDLWAPAPLAKPSLLAFFPLGFAQFLAGAALQ
jgi:hypothetical protein